MEANVLGIAEGADFQYDYSIEVLLLNLAQMLHKSTSAPLLAIPCWRSMFSLLRLSPRKFTIIKVEYFQIFFWNCYAKNSFVIKSIFSYL